MYSSCIFASSSFSSFCLALTLSASATLILSSRFAWTTQLKTREPSEHQQCCKSMQIQCFWRLFLPFLSFLGFDLYPFLKRQAAEATLIVVYFPKYSERPFDKPNTSCLLPFSSLLSFDSYFDSFLVSTSRASAADGCQRNRPKCKRKDPGSSSFHPPKQEYGTNHHNSDTPCLFLFSFSASLCLLFFCRSLC